MIDRHTATTSSANPRSASVAAAYLCCCFAGIVAAQSAEPRPLARFEEHVITDDLPGAYSVRAADLDGDGDLDLIASGDSTHNVKWYESKLR